MEHTKNAEHLEGQPLQGLSFNIANGRIWGFLLDFFNEFLFIGGLAFHSLYPKLPSL